MTLQVKEIFKMGKKIGYIAYFILLINANKLLVGQTISFDIVASEINMFTGKDSIILAIIDEVQKIEYSKTYCFNSNNQLILNSERNNLDSLIFQRKLQYDKDFNLTEESIIDLLKNKIDFYNYYNEYKFGKLMYTQVLKTNVKMYYSYNVFGKLKQVNINTNNDSTEYIFGYPKMFEYDFEYDMVKSYFYKHGNLVEVEMKKNHPKYIELYIIRYKYNSQGLLINELHDQDGCVINEIIYNYDQFQRLTEIIQGVIAYKINYLTISETTASSIKVNRNDQLLFDIKIQSFNSIRN